MGRGPGPLLIKIDVEGAELEVLRGAVKTLRDTEIVICEVGVEPRHTGQAELADVLVFMRSQGFRLFDIVDMDASRNGALSYVDAVFAKEAGILFGANEAHARE